MQNGFFETLENLAEVGPIKSNYEKAKDVFEKIKSNHDYRVIVATNPTVGVVSTTTLLIEQKFIHDGGKVGHIEDVATRKGYQGEGFGSLVINKIKKIAEEAGCYKIILDCSDDPKVIEFYTKNGFKRHGNEMRYDIRNSKTGAR